MKIISWLTSNSYLFLFSDLYTRKLNMYIVYVIDLYSTRNDSIYFGLVRILVSLYKKKKNCWH